VGHIEIKKTPHKDLLTMKASIFSPHASRSTLPLINATTPQSQINLGLKLKEFGQQLLLALIGNTEPRIWMLTNSRGDIYWRIYDPSAQTFFVFNTEHEVRIWIEQRYSNPQ
jgi:hypothetical protein